MQPNRYLARQNISIPIVGTLKPVSSAQFLLVREVCKGYFVQVWNKKNEKTTLMIIAYGPTEYFHFNRGESFHFYLKTLKPFLPN